MSKLENPLRDPQWNGRRMLAAAGLIASVVGVLALWSRQIWDAFSALAMICFWVGLLCGGAFFYLDYSALRGGSGKRGLRISPRLLKPAYGFAYYCLGSAVVGLAAATAQLINPFVSGWLALAALALACWLMLRYVHTLVDSAVVARKAPSRSAAPKRKVAALALKKPRRAKPSTARSASPRHAARRPSPSLSAKSR